MGFGSTALLYWANYLPSASVSKLTNEVKQYLLLGSESPRGFNPQKALAAELAL